MSSLTSLFTVPPSTLYNFGDEIEYCIFYSRDGSGGIVRGSVCEIHTDHLLVQRNTQGTPWLASLDKVAYQNVLRWISLNERRQEESIDHVC